MYEGLGIRFTKERKKLSRKAIVIIVIAGVLVAIALGYVAFWNSRVHAVFDKFYSADTFISHDPREYPTGTKYVTYVDKPFILEFVGFASIETSDGDVSVFMNPNILTGALDNFYVMIEYKRTSDANGDFGYLQGIDLNKDWNAYALETAPGIDVQALVNEHRAELEEMFEEIYDRWGYRLPSDEFPIVPG
ncbi:MAG: hypothetical protein LBK23_05795 [Oscillospiraceae bacterium]|jgi:hypothetical protein|nr:hypothetical protein [Oscillospiraceae bacterium]